MNEIHYVHQDSIFWNVITSRRYTTATEMGYLIEQLSCPVLKNAIIGIDPTEVSPPTLPTSIRWTVQAQKYTGVYAQKYTNDRTCVTCPWCLAEALTKLASAQDDLTLFLDQAIAAVASVREDRRRELHWSVLVSKIVATDA